MHRPERGVVSLGRPRFPQTTNVALPTHVVQSFLFFIISKHHTCGAPVPKKGDSEKVPVKLPLSDFFDCPSLRIDAEGGYP